MTYRNTNLKNIHFFFFLVNIRKCTVLRVRHFTHFNKHLSDKKRQIAREVGERKKPRNFEKQNQVLQKLLAMKILQGKGCILQMHKKRGSTVKLSNSFDYNICGYQFMNPK